MSYERSQYYIISSAVVSGFLYIVIGKVLLADTILTYERKYNITDPHWSAALFSAITIVLVGIWFYRGRKHGWHFLYQSPGSRFTENQRAAFAAVLTGLAAAMIADGYWILTTTPELGRESFVYDWDPAITSLVVLGPAVVAGVIYKLA